MELAESVLLPATPNPSCLQRTASRKLHLGESTPRDWAGEYYVFPFWLMWDTRTSSSLAWWRLLPLSVPHFTPSSSFHRHQSPRSTLYSKLHLSVCPENLTCHTCPHPTDLGVNWEDPPHSSFLEGVTRFVQNYKSLAFLGYFLDICWVILGYFFFGYFLGNSWVFLWLTLGYFSSLWFQQGSWGHKACKGPLSTDTAGGFISSIHILITPTGKLPWCHISYLVFSELPVSTQKTLPLHCHLAFMKLSSLLDGILWIKDAVFHLKVAYGTHGWVKSLEGFW